MSARQSQRPASSIRPVRYSTGASVQDVYSFALRTAYLHYLLQPRPRTRVSIQAPLHRSSTSVSQLIAELGAGSTKSNRLPKDFLPLFKVRLEAVWMGKESNREYQDDLVKRSFAAFYTKFAEKQFQKQVKESRKPEDLILIFFSNATKEMQKREGDNTWIVDLHLALFIRLITSVLKQHGWNSSHSDLYKRLNEMESKLLRHDQSIADGVGSSTSMTGPPAELSYRVKDMPMVKTVARVFEMPLDMVQQDIDKNKDVWTEKAALQDLKSYTYNLGSNTTRTLRKDDFEFEEAFEMWKKHEKGELSKAMLLIASANPVAVKQTPSNRPPSSFPMDGHIRNQSVASVTDPYGEFGPVDDSDDVPYVFIPPEPRSWFRTLMLKCMLSDLKDVDPTADITFFSKTTTELVDECYNRWRLPFTSRLVLFLDVIRELFADDKVTVDHVDTAFMLFKDQVEPDFHLWTIADQQLQTKLLTGIENTLLRDLYQLLLTAFDSKMKPIGPIMYVLESHITGDPLFKESDLEQYLEQVKVGMMSKVEDVYIQLLQELPKEPSEIEPFHLAELSKKLVKWTEKVSKRFKQPLFGSVDPVMILIEVVYPKFAVDARDLYYEMSEEIKQKEEQEFGIDEGFQLYEDLSEVRRIFLEAFPKGKFPLNLEELFESYVWRFIKNMEKTVPQWVDQAIKQDNFLLREHGEDEMLPDEERHSSSAVDIFRSFNEVGNSITKLNWKDDEMQAKFMTAFSKILVSGLMRYCEVLEKMFTHEMDRQTPEQEAAARQTRQERWISLAREAWSNKEKIEPFQFAPESCVKLNNIEFSLNQLDKLDKTIDTEKWALIIADMQAKQPQPRRRQNNYVFTIKIVEAEDLKPMDMNGYSDPYVVLGDEYQKRLAKTRVVYANLNPRWEESVDITTQGPIWLTATVWDWDTMGDHDCVGRTSIKLDPAHFGDFMPREYWLDLDTQGRLLLRVSMEGERDDIGFYFGKAFRALKRGERDMARQVTDKLSAYIHHCLSRQALKNVLSKGVSISSVTSLFSRTGFGGARPQSVATQPVNQLDVANALTPLTDYFNENFAILNRTLTTTNMKLIMSKVWKEVLVTIEALLVPTLSDKPSQQKPLTQQEVDVVFKWLAIMEDFFLARDEVTGEITGVPLGMLKSPKYHELQSLNFFYFDSTENLIRTSERMASEAAARKQRELEKAKRTSNMSMGNSLTVPAGFARRSKSILNSRNLGTMRKVKEQRRQEAQAEPNDDMILRILRMRPEAAGYLRDRSRQKERLAAAAAAELIVRQSMNAAQARHSQYGGGVMGNRRQSNLGR
ncbi:hypothetical protein BJ508DRAFT_176765 [Ascobolus immersus RN42]|uniref:C2 domain protein n=1 Tax=Ascobolus immersus RN42 TaxID=1160509 RepID=A0A3N4II06_ASCIM|nr:hypothetical protein BJ508DRAFT_176765 [Ascobolus immersus RN42]